MMLFIQFDLNGKLVFQQIILEDKRKEFESSEAKELEGEILYFNKIFVDIQSFYRTQFPLTETLEKLANLVPDGVKLSNLAFTKENKDFSFTGIAETREILLELKKNLEKYISAAGDFNELLAVLDMVSGIQGSKEFFDSKRLKEIINIRIK